MTPQDIITDARGILNDTDATQPRNTDAELLRYVNDGLLEVAALRPSLFSDTQAFTCAANQCDQAIALTVGTQVLDVVSIQGGAALTMFDSMTLDQFRPGWRNDTAGTPEQWSLVKSDPQRFDLYPRPSSALTLTIRVSATPPAYAIGDTIALLPDVYKPALVDYVINRAELKDDEHVLTQRSTLMYASFLGKIGVKGATNGGSGQ